MHLEQQKNSNKQKNPEKDVQSIENMANVQNEARRVSRLYSFLRYFSLLFCGIAFAAIFPPLNWHWLAWFGLVPLYYLVKDLQVKSAWFGGLIWGFAWIATFTIWLREIEPFTPFAVGFVLAILTAFWAAAIPIAQRYIFIPIKVQLEGYNAITKYHKTKNNYIAEFVFALVLASLWCVLEWIRSWIFTGFPWDLLGISQWQQISLIQISSYTGVYGVSFIIVFFNVALARTATKIFWSFKGGRYFRPIPLYIALALIAGTVLIGIYQINARQPDKNDTILKTLLIEGDIPQSRFYSEKEAVNALDIYTKLSAKMLTLKPEIMIWPESAVPQPLRGGGELSEKYRNNLANLITTYKTPVLLGTIDYGIDSINPDGRIPIYNSAMFIDSEGRIVDTYNKIHLVPWGEYTPLGGYYPFKWFYPWIKKTFGMGRSLTPGKRSTIFNLKQGVRAAVLICYEDVFARVARKHVLNNANLLISITNDAWFPNSSEPEQHLAQAVFRAVEANRVMLRSGNGSGTCVIQPSGIISDSLFWKHDKNNKKLIPYPAKRGRGGVVFNVNIKEHPPLTFYTKYGNVFVTFCGTVCIIWLFWMLWQWKEKKDQLMKLFE